MACAVLRHFRRRLVCVECGYCVYRFCCLMVFIRDKLHLLKAKYKHAIRAKYLQLLTSITPQILSIFRYQCRLSTVQCPCFRITPFACFAQHFTINVDRLG